MAPPEGRVETGRIYPRIRSYECHSCHQRASIGKPKSGEGTWPARLHIPEAMMDVLLIAAAEFNELSEEAGEYCDAIAFLDWVRPDAISKAWESPVKVEAAPVTLAEKRRRHAAGAA